MIEVRLKEILKEQKKSKYWLYKRLGFSYQNLSNIMNGKTGGMRYETMERLCRLLECTPNDLFRIVPD
jgi:putative transcriptional regulator